MTVVIFFAVTTVAFLPVVLRAYAYYEKGSGRVVFALYLYGFLKLLGGYACVKDGVVLIHAGETRAVAFKGGFGGTGLLEGFSVREVSLAFSAEENYPYYRLAASFLSGTLFPVLSSVSAAKKKIVVKRGGNDFSLKVEVAFNAFSLMKAYAGWLWKRSKRATLNKL